MIHLNLDSYFASLGTWNYDISERNHLHISKNEAIIFKKKVSTIPQNSTSSDLSRNQLWEAESLNSENHPPPFLRYWIMGSVTGTKFQRN